MIDSSQNTFVLGLMDILITDGIGAAQNGLIHSMALWLDDHIKGELVRERKEEACQRFYKSVTACVQQKKYQRRIWGEKQLLPLFKKDQVKAIDEISSKVLRQIKEMSFEQGLDFIAELYAAWILTCPEIMMRNSSQFKSSITTGSESELINLMLQYLDIYMTM
jgi:hypothetical protein